MTRPAHSIGEPVNLPIPHPNNPPAIATRSDSSPAGEGEQWVLSSPVATRRQTVGILSARLRAGDLRYFRLVTAREV